VILFVCVFLFASFIRLSWSKWAAQNSVTIVLCVKKNNFASK
jgi:hypothetical protein